MKKILLIILMVTLAMGGAYAQKKKNKKQAAVDNRPTVFSVVGATNEEFFLFFDGTKQNKNPQNKYQIKNASLNEEYNVRVLLKKPSATTDMAYTTLKPKSMGEEWVVYYNARRDRVELMSRAQYNDMKAKEASQKKAKINKSNLMRPKGKAFLKDSNARPQFYRIGPSQNSKTGVNKSDSTATKVQDTIQSK